MDNGIKSSSAGLVSMPGKLLRYACPKDGLASRVMKNMKTNHAGIKIAVVRFGFHPRTSLLK
jgi:hypothetical protein